MMQEEDNYPVCPGCKQTIDPGWCHCGESMRSVNHGNHTAIPAGCVCFYDTNLTERWKKEYQQDFYSEIDPSDRSGAFRND